MIRFLRMYIPFAIIVMAICYFCYLLVSRDIIREAEVEDAALVRLEQQLLADDFRSFASDLFLVANMQEWNSAFDASGKGAFNQLATEFKNLLESTNRYEKFRLMDLHGQELLRVNSHQGQVSIAPDSQLQHKSHRYYFAASRSLHQNQIYISPMDLNWEHGKLEQPLKPVIRLITPVFDAGGHKRGLLVLNVMAESMMQRFMDKHANFPQRSLLVNRQGEWLHDGRTTEHWDFLLPDQPRKHFSAKFPEAWGNIDQQEHGQLVTPQGMFTFTTLRPLQAAYQALPNRMRHQAGGGSAATQRVWKIIEHRSPAELAALTAPLAQQIVAYTLFLLLLLAILVWRKVVNTKTRKAVELQLRKSELKFRHLVEDLPDGLVVVIDTKVAYANSAANALFYGNSGQRLVGKQIIDFVHMESRQLVMRRLQDVMNGQLAESAEEHLLTVEGDSIFALVTSMPVEFEGRQAMQTVIRDITEQRKAEGALRLSQQRHELYVKQTHIAVIEWDNDFRVIAWNHGAEVIFGYSAEQARGKTSSELILTSDQQPVVDEISQKLLANKGGAISINENITSDGRIITCEWHNTPLIRKDGRVVGVTSLCRDISEQQRQQNELLKLQQAIENAGEAILITGVDDVIEYVNPAFSKVTGYSAEEVMGQTPKILNSVRQGRAYYQHIWQKISSGETWHGSLVNQRKDGSLYPASMSIAPIFEADGSITHYVSIQQDMSEYEELEAKFRQAQKMEALGTLVGGIAHDFNNVLAGILGNLYLVKKQTADDAGVQTNLHRIEQAGQRAADMIRQLLAFARKGESEISPMPVQPFIKEILKLARSSIPENIALQHDLGEQDYLIRGDGSQMQQVMLNLLVNASHALEGRHAPVIKVSMHRYEPDDDFLFVHHEMDHKPMLCITVADNGCGISKANLEHVFEPFFTTKAEGKGTGLGLAMVYGLMQNHGGVIDVESEEGSGTRMKLYFPLSDSSDVADAKESVDVISGKDEVILLADDNDNVREIMQEILRDFGYRVVAAENGKQALMMFVDHASEIKLALLDIVMPVMGGVEAAKRLRELNPDLPILFLSGYEKGVSPNNEPETDDMTVLTKPVDLAELSHHIHKSIKK